MLCTQESQLAPLATKNTVSGHSHCTGSTGTELEGLEDYIMWYCCTKEAYIQQQRSYRNRQTPDMCQPLIFGLEIKPLQDGCDTGGRAWDFIAWMIISRCRPVKSHASCVRHTHLRVISRSHACISKSHAFAPSMLLCSLWTLKHYVVSISLTSLSGYWQVSQWLIQLYPLTWRACSSSQLVATNLIVKLPLYVYSVMNFCLDLDLHRSNSSLWRVFIVSWV